MSLQISDHWTGLTDDRLSSVRAELSARVLEVVLELSADAITAWASAIAPVKYASAGFGKIDAEQLIAARSAQPFRSLTDVCDVVGLAKTSDLVYASAAGDAVDPRCLLVEEVYDVSAFNGIEALAMRQVSVPDPGELCRLEVQAAYVALEGSSKTIEIRPSLRQRDFEDTWAEIDIGRRQRIWMVGVSQSLLSSAVQSGQILLFSRLGSDFLKVPGTVIKVATPPLSNPPESEFATDHQFFGFPEIEGEMFMIRAIVPPEPELDEDGLPVDPNWPFAYRFHAEDGDLLIFGPSFPADVEVRTGGKDVLYRHSGELSALTRSRDLADDVQAVVDTLRERLQQAPEVASRFLLTATSSRPGELDVGLEADVHAVIDRFADGESSHGAVFTPGSHVVELPLAIPAIGEPLSGSVAVKGLITNSIIEQILGEQDSATGDERIGIRLAGDTSYSQSFVAATEFAVSGVDIRLANVAAGTIIQVAIHSADGQVSTSATIPASGRVPFWCSLRFDEHLLLAADTGHSLAVRVESGAATWLCGSGDDVNHLKRVEKLRSPSMVVDVTDGGPLIGRARLRRDLPLDEPELSLALMPGEHEVALRDVMVAADGRMEATVELLPGLRALDGQEAALRVMTRSEGELLFQNLDIRYQLIVRTE